MTKIYCITADYRPHNEHKPHYYVAAKTPKEAKYIFSSIMTWMKIYEVVECDAKKSEWVKTHPYDCILF